MGLDDSMIDGAIDKAMDMAEIPAESTEAPLVSDEQQTDIAVKEAVEKPTRDRDERGKFARKAKTEEADEPSEQVSDQTADVENNEAPAEGTATAEDAPIEVPTFWPAELKALAAEAKDKELVKGFVSLYQQQEEWGRRNATEAEKAKSYEKRFYEDFEKPEAIEAHKAELRLQGVSDPIQELHRYRDWDRVFKTSPKAGIAALMQRNGLTPYDFTNEDLEDSQQSEEDSRYQQAIARAEAVEKKLEDFQVQQETAVLRSMVETFKAGKDSSGAVRKPFAEFYHREIDRAFNDLKAEAPHLSHADALDHAYEFVKDQVQKLHGTVLKAPAPQKTKEQLIAESKRAQAANTSMSGAPTTEMKSQKPRLKGKDFNEKIENAFDMALERVSA
jgi:DNA-binding transcriptional regulator GbsR (MarR family)